VGVGVAARAGAGSSAPPPPQATSPLISDAISVRRKLTDCSLVLAIRLDQRSNGLASRGQLRMTPPLRPLGRLWPLLPGLGNQALSEAVGRTHSNWLG
jgi:hypothetical protein